MRHRLWLAPAPGQSGPSSSTVRNSRQPKRSAECLASSKISTLRGLEDPWGLFHVTSRRKPAGGGLQSCGKAGGTALAQMLDMTKSADHRRVSARSALQDGSAKQACRRQVEVDRQHCVRSSTLHRVSKHGSRQPGRHSAAAANCFHFQVARMQDWNPSVMVFTTTCRVARVAGGGRSVGWRPAHIDSGRPIPCSAQSRPSGHWSSGTKD